MYGLVIPPSLCRSDSQVESLRNTHANPAHWEIELDEDCFVVGPDGVVGRLVTDCQTDKLVRDTREQFAKVHGDLTNRGSVLGKGSMMADERVDGTFSLTTKVPSSIRDELRANNVFSDYLGWVDKGSSGRHDSCRQTAWSINEPIIHEAAIPFVQEVERVYREELPHHWREQAEFMRHVSRKWRFPGSSISTVTVNRNLRTTYHTDSNDFRGGMGNLVVLDGGEDGELVMPKFRIKFRVRPRSVLLMNVHEMHGNLPFTGERLTAVLYAREHIDRCDK